MLSSSFDLLIQGGMKVQDDIIERNLGSVARLMEQIKTMDFGSGQGANHSDTRRYRADLQRRHGCEDALSCFDIFGLQY